jgi:hypothetical protein
LQIALGRRRPRGAGDSGSRSCRVQSGWKEEKRRKMRRRKKREERENARDTEREEKNKQWNRPRAEELRLTSEALLGEGKVVFKLRSWIEEFLAEELDTNNWDGELAMTECVRLDKW